MSVKGKIARRGTGQSGTRHHQPLTSILAPWPVAGPSQQLVDAQQVLHLQRLVGNRAVISTVQRQTGTALDEGPEAPLLVVPEIVNQRVNALPELSEDPIAQAELASERGRMDGMEVEQLGVGPSRPALSQFFASLAGAAGGAFSAVLSGAGKVASAIGRGASWLGGKIAAGSKAVGGAVVSGAKAVGRGASWLGGKIKSGARSAWGAIKSGASWLGGKIKGGAGIVKDWWNEGKLETRREHTPGSQQMDEHIAGKERKTYAGVTQTATSLANTGVGQVHHVASFTAHVTKLIGTVTGAIGLFFSTLQSALDLRALISSGFQQSKLDKMAKEAKEKAIAEGHTEEEATEIVSAVRYAMEQKYSKMIKRAIAFSGGIVSMIAGAGALAAITLGTNPIGWAILAGIGAAIGIGLLAYKIYRWYKKKYKTGDLGAKRLKMARQIVAKLKGGDSLAKQVVVELHLEPAYVAGLDEAVAIDKVMEKLRSS